MCTRKLIRTAELAKITTMVNDNGEKEWLDNWRKAGEQHFGN